MVAVTETVFTPPTVGIVHAEEHTKCFLGERDCGEGTLYITESLLLWKCDSNNEHIQLQYPSISLHAISRDTDGPNKFPHQCLYCLLDSSEVAETTTERDPYPDVTEVRFAPMDTNNLQSMYDALTSCQELHPDDDAIDHDDEMGDYDAGEFAESQFYTAENMDNVELSEEGQAVLARLQQNMQIISPEEFGHIIQNGADQPNGQFDDADDANR